MRSRSWAVQTPKQVMKWPVIDGSASAGGAASSTRWPRSTRRWAVTSTAAAISGSVGVEPSGASATHPMRSEPTSAPTSSAKGRAGGGAQ